MPNNHPVRKRMRNLGLAAIAGQAGCATLIIVLIALFVGLWFDNQLEQSGLCTIGLIILSIPFSLYVMLRIALGAINLIEPPLNEDISTVTKE